MRRVNRKGVRQRDVTDCGPACIASIMAHYGLDFSVAGIRQFAGTDRYGTSMWGMTRALDKLDFESKGLRGTDEHLDKLPTPFIAHIDQKDGIQHYICVYGVGQKQIRVMDPADGRITRWGRDDFNRKWSGAVIAMVRRIPCDHISEIKKDRFRIFSLLKPVGRPVLQAVFAAVLYTILGLSTSVYLGKLTDHVFLTGNTGLLNLMSSVMLLIAFLMIYLFLVRQLVILKTGQVIDNQLITSYYRHLFRLPQRFFDTMRTGEIISRMNDAVKIRGFINDATISILVNLLIFIFSFTIMFILHWKLAFLLLGMIPLYTLVFLFYNNRNRKFERRVMEQSASFESHLVESLQSSVHIKQHNLHDFTMGKTEKRLNTLLDTLYRSGVSSLSAMGSTELINRVFTIVLLWAGSYLVISQQLTPGSLLSFYALAGYLTGPVSGLIGANKTYQNALIAADRLFEVFHLETDPCIDKQRFRKEEFGDIIFHGVTFAYGTRGSLFRDLELTIRAGLVTAITGASGSGKSTVASLIQQLYPVEKGYISINGCDTRQFSGDSIRALMGVVPQQIRFLHGTIMENIAPGIPDPDIRRICALLDRVGLMQVVESLPEGLESVLVHNGSNLSGGERQRLAIVRALYREPSLLILDEATSGLDAISQYHVNRLLLELKDQSQTILLISHHNRISSLADHTVQLEGGKISGFRH